VVTGKGFSMIEMMITVVIIAVCLIVALRVFSICGIVVSGAYNNAIAIDILQKRIDELQETAITSDGIGKSSASAENIVEDGRRLRFSQKITAWKDPLDEVAEEGSEKGVEKDTGLNEVQLSVNWGVHGRRKGLTLKTLLPAKGYGQDF